MIEFESHRSCPSNSLGVTAITHLSLDTKELQLKITDDGRGIPAKRLRGLIEQPAEAGVGLAGMRERIRELGGSLKSGLIGQGRWLSFAFLSKGLPLIPNRMANRFAAFLLHKAHPNRAVQVVFEHNHAGACPYDM
jgi:hypothetical protein